MPNLNKLHDDALRIATGGTRRIVSGSSTGYADVRSGPGEDYDLVYRIFNGNPVYTTSTHRTCGNAIWYELTDGNWIAGSLIGY